MRPELTQGIAGASLLAGAHLVISLTVTRVEPGGEFKAHQDSYHHLLYFFKGEGVVTIEGMDYRVTQGTVAEIPAGKTHGYVNRGSEEMLLITANLKA